MLEIIPNNTRFDFVGVRKTALAISLAAILACLALILIHGLNLGIDFAGGSLVQARFASPKATDEVRAAVAEFGAVDVQDLGREGTEFLIRVPLSEENSESVNARVTGKLAQTFGADKVEILRVEAVGPRVGEALRVKALLAVLFSTLTMGVYIWIRFEWRFGLGAGIALLHDVIITSGFLVLFGYEFDLSIVAALLTVVGFSVNDTVIVSDRIRENRAKDRRAPLANVINRSINETLSRTILTTGTAVMVVVSLFVLGGSVIHAFAFALLVGFIVGTYSSVFIAAPVVLFFESAGAPAATERGAARSTAPASRRT